MYSSFPPIPPFSFPLVLNTPPVIKHASILNYLDIAWLAQNNPSRSKAHPTTFTNLYIHSLLPLATFNCFMLLTPQMKIHFQCTAMAPKGSPKGKGEVTARAKTPTSVENRCLPINRDCIKGCISEQIRGLIWIYNVCGLKDDRAWDLIYDIIFLDPVTTHHFSQFQLMWLHRRSRSSNFQDWWGAFRSYTSGKALALR
jgi:hypothetical protein